MLVGVCEVWGYMKGRDGESGEMGFGWADAGGCAMRLLVASGWM